jgi:hypothetical protein
MADDPRADLGAVELVTGGDPTVTVSEHLCPWCSADLGGPEPDRCPACGARLMEDPDATIPGVTTVDPAAVRKAASWSPAPKRRFLGLLVDAEPVQESGVRPSSAEALAPPSAEVRREMELLRAELAAAAAAEAERIAAVEAAEAESIAAEARGIAAQAVDAADASGPGQTVP